MESKRYPEAKTHRELKEKLFYDIIDCLDKGKVGSTLPYLPLPLLHIYLHHYASWILSQMWEKGIEMCKELALQYELETLDYVRLSEILVSVL